MMFWGSRWELPFHLFCLQTRKHGSTDRRTCCGSDCLPWCWHCLAVFGDQVALKLFFWHFYLINLKVLIEIQHVYTEVKDSNRMKNEEKTTSATAPTEPIHSIHSTNNCIHYSFYIRYILEIDSCDRVEYEKWRWYTVNNSRCWIVYIDW